MIIEIPQPPQQMKARDRAKLIAALGADGLTSRDIAKELGISKTRVNNIAYRYNIKLSRPGLRRFSFYTPDRGAHEIRMLAAEAEVSPATMIVRLLRVSLDDGLDQARKKLGKLAVPPKLPGPWTRRRRRLAAEALAKAAQS